MSSILASKDLISLDTQPLHVAEGLAELQPHGTLPDVWSHVRREASEGFRPVLLHFRVCRTHEWASGDQAWVQCLESCPHCQAEKATRIGKERFVRFQTARATGLI